MGRRRKEKKDEKKASGDGAEVWLFCIHVSVYDKNTKESESPSSSCLSCSPNYAVTWHMNETHTCIHITHGLSSQKINFLEEEVNFPCLHP